MLGIYYKPRLKVFLAIFSLSALLLIIFLSAFLLHKKQQSDEAQKLTDAFVSQIRVEVATRNVAKKVPDQIEKKLESVQNRKLPEQKRYDALISLAFYFSNEYSLSHDAKIRQISKDVIGKYAKEQFPGVTYNKTIFEFICADPSCGPPVSPEIKQALDLIAKSNLPENIKVTVNQNLTSAAYMTNNNLSDKIFGIRLSIVDLQQSGNSTGSEAADLLTSYLEKNYKVGVYPAAQEHK